ncbi:hypothetical protein DFH09DRAFT_349360 [Mycena vulgaris]|nr:hypothetical protein DFH09DRAFT_349360 [Mycena vulgaris]
MESPFKDILYTNAVPSDADFQSIHDLLGNSRQEIAALTGQIIATQKLLDELTERRAALDEFVSAHLALMSPVRRMPLDIVQEIFVASLPDNPGMTEADAPLLLCHICRAWRSLALSTPRLWQSLNIVVPSYDRMSSMTNAAKTWLSRSGVLPLSISIATTNDRIAFESDMSMLLDAIIPTSLRWEHIQFRTISTYESFSPLACLSPEDVPILRTASIIALMRDTENDTPSTVLTEWKNFSFIGAPSLHSASIPGQPRHFDGVPLLWERLRRLSFRSGVFTPADVALSLLKQCPLLETLSLAVTHGISPAICRMERLQHLYVIDDGRQTTSFFDNLVAPQLVCLEYIGTPRLGTGFPFTTTLSSSRSLERLSLRTEGVPTETLLATLSLVPTLRHLSLSGEPTLDFQPDADFISALNWRPDSDAMLCPNLQRVELLRFKSMSDETLLQFILVRRAPALGDAIHLASIRAVLRRDMQEDIIPTLQPLIADGLAVSLKYDQYSSQQFLPGTDDWAPFSQSQSW